MSLIETVPQRFRQGQALTSPALISLDYLSPPPALVPYVTTFFRLRCGEARIADIQPASVGILAVFLRGEGDLFLRNGRVDNSHPTSLLTPLAAAAPMLVQGPWDVFGASLSPLGWAALAGGRSAADHGNRLVEAGSLLGDRVRQMGARIIAGFADGSLDDAGMLAMMAETLLAGLGPVPSEHVVLIRAVADWLGQSLSPRVEDLHAQVLYSPRQLQRLVDRYFGLPPKQLARKYRALRATALLGQPQIDEDRVAEILGHFHDLSHLRRELQLFAGRTPPQLGGDDLPLNAALVDLRNFREISPQVARIPASLT